MNAPITPSHHDEDTAIEEKIDALLAQMTLTEKVGQMNQYNAFWDVTGPLSPDVDTQQKYAHLREGRVGSMLNAQSSRSITNIRKFQEIAVNETRLGIPLLFGLDVIHGYNTMFPIPLAESCSWDLEGIEESARIAALEATAVGVNWTFAPMVDISRDSRWGRVMEGAGEDPFLGALVGAARVRGFQGDDLASPDTIAATAKHFAAYGFSEAGRDYNIVDIGTSTLYNTVLPPFKAAVEAGVQSLMNAFNTLNGIPASAHQLLLRTILKGEWNFDGVVVSDWASFVEMITHGYAADLKQVAELVANAGSDVDMESHAFIRHLEELVNEGHVSEEVVDDAVRRILRVKFRLGLFDDPYRYCDPDKADRVLKHPDHLAAALDLAKKSIVLLKNEGQLLPLNKEQKNIAVIGTLAADKETPIGNWDAEADDGSAISLIEGLQEYTAAFTYVPGAGPLTGNDTSGFDQAIALAQKSEVVILVLGEHRNESGEARSKTDLHLPAQQQALLEAVYAVNPNIVLVLMNGRPLILDWAAEHIPAILETWHLGEQSGHAIAQVLFGDYNPSGKLTMSFPRSVGQMPLYYNRFSTGRPVFQVNRFWSHYIDEENDALFPFGHGLSYTEFGYSDLAVDVQGSTVQVNVTVTNQGDRVGEEVTQLYLRDRVASVVRPIKELKGFQKFSLAPGETRQVAFLLTSKELGFYDNSGRFIVEPGDFDVMVGPNSANGLSASFTLT